MPKPLASERLDLVSLDVVLLEAMLAGDLEEVERLGGFFVPANLSLSRRALQRRLHQLRARPDLLPWLVRGIVIRESRLLCGRIGFHSAPGPEDLRAVAPDGVELGYEVAPSFRRRGYAREAAIRLMKWAYDDHGQRCFVLSIAPHNGPSIAMAISMGFQEVGSIVDEEDGTELYFLRRLDGWPPDWTK